MLWFNPKKVTKPPSVWNSFLFNPPLKEDITDEPLVCLPSLGWPVQWLWGQGGQGPGVSEGPRRLWLRERPQILSFSAGFRSLDWINLLTKTWPAFQESSLALVGYWWSRQRNHGWMSMSSRTVEDIKTVFCDFGFILSYLCEDKQYIFKCIFKHECI